MSQTVVGLGSYVEEFGLCPEGNEEPPNGWELVRDMATLSFLEVHSGC